MTVSIVLSLLFQILNLFAVLDNSARIKMMSIKTFGDLSRTVANNMVSGYSIIV